MNPVVVDTNVLFSILLQSDGRLRRHMLESSDRKFFCCRFAIVELFRHKEKLLKYSKLAEEELLEAFQILLARLSFHDELSISEPSIRAAHTLCVDVDEKDAPFVALTIELRGRLWTGDKVLIDGLKAQGFSDFYEPD